MVALQLSFQLIPHSPPPWFTHKATSQNISTSLKCAFVRSKSDGMTVNRSPHAISNRWLSRRRDQLWRRIMLARRTDSQQEEKIITSEYVLQQGLSNWYTNNLSNYPSCGWCTRAFCHLRLPRLRQVLALRLSHLVPLGLNTLQHSAGIQQRSM